MPEPKGRSGKKPKYQIADIGGTDLTSEDISTERVLNFLIKGEMGAVGEGGPSPSAEIGSALSPPAKVGPESALLSERNEYAEASEPPAKKSLSHLFERAGGSPASVRDEVIISSENEPVPVPSSTDAARDQLVVRETVSDSGSADNRSLDVSSAQLPGATPIPFVPSASATISESDSSAPDLGSPAAMPSASADQVDRWKSLYRLNSGEIAALKILCLLSEEDGSSECYIKMRKLAEMSSLDYRYCQKVVRSLERLGWITKLQDYDPSTQMGVLYRVNSRPVHLT
jgi:hypothetical protein